MRIVQKSEQPLTYNTSAAYIVFHGVTKDVMFQALPRVALSSVAVEVCTFYYIIQIREEAINKRGL